MRWFLSLIMGFLLIFSISYAKSERYYYQKMEEKCKKLESIVKPIVIGKKYRELCDKARYCFRKFNLEIYCDGEGSDCVIFDTVCFDASCMSGDKYCLSNCECINILKKLNIISKPFTFY